MAAEIDRSEKVGKKKSPSSKSRYLLNADAYYCQICGTETKGTPNTLSISRGSTKSTVKKNLKLCPGCLQKYNDQNSEIFKKVNDMIV